MAKVFLRVKMSAGFICLILFAISVIILVAGHCFWLISECCFSGIWFVCLCLVSPFELGIFFAWHDKKIKQKSINQSKLEMYTTCRPNASDKKTWKAFRTSIFLKQTRGWQSFQSVPYAIIKARRLLIPTCKENLISFIRLETTNKVAPSIGRTEGGTGGGGLRRRRCIKVGSPSSDKHATEDHGSILKARRRFFVPHIFVCGAADSFIGLSHENSDCVCASLGVGNTLWSAAN